jgi:hypothetical protein
MKRLIVMCVALVLALAPAATAEAAKGGKPKGAGKTCVAKAKKASKGKKAKRAKKACAKKVKKVGKAKKTTSAATAGAERECRADRRVDPEGFAADFGSSADAVAKCAAELLGHGTSDDVVPEDEPLEDELPETQPADDGAADPAPFVAEADLPGNDDDIV